MRKLLPSTKTVLILATVAAVIIGTGVATGAIPGADGTITACYKTKGGAVRVIDGESAASCASDEVKLSWSQRGPVGSTGPKGDKGDPGIQGPVSSDPGSRLQLRSEADLPSGQTMVMTIDSIEVLRVSTYRINCATSGSSPGTCELILGAAASASLDVDSWYTQASQGEASATKSFSLVIFDETGTPIRKYVVVNGRPTALLTQGDRYQLTLKAEGVEKVSPN